ncbi:mitotic interactor and substrate of PLK1 isoform X2 [Numida meleagris]|uniref:mitotic interactor and substrate of PLK1 isoform X2 n=1 Tax=Numida meleagris TaxID=8996 RepID=UPI000B3E31E8|nr:mitotic interactor and substrate of PLK1 isoform X2 [Numida meleagris]
MTISAQELPILGQRSKGLLRHHYCAQRRLPTGVAGATLRGQQDLTLHSGHLQVNAEPTQPQEELSVSLDADSARAMDRVTRHLVFQFPHTRDQNDAYQGDADGDDDIFGPSPYSSQKENGYEMKTRLKSPSYFLESGKDAWNPSPDRESQLEVVRSGSLYDIRAYRNERKPSKLYEDDEPDPYRLQPPNISPEKAKELEDKRREVIRGQVVRKSSTMAEKWSSMDELSSIAAGGQGHGVPGTFAICFDKPSPGRAVTPVDPESIDREQINFSAARQQFLMLEKSSPGALFSPGYATSPRPEVTVRTTRQEWHGPDTVTRAEKGHGDATGPGQGGMERSIYTVYSVQHQATGKEEGYGRGKGDTNTSHPTGRAPGLARASSRDDLDSGLGEAYSGGSVGYSSNGSDVPNGLGDARDGGGSAEGSGETPIEREIRRALEREESLWKERGMRRLTSSSELVEIQTKPLLSLHAAPAQGRKGKDKGRASFNVQREIEKETKREEDLRRQGRLPGLYDRGTPQELGELRRVFEQEEHSPQQQQQQQQPPSSSRRAAERPRSPGDGLADGARTGRALSSPGVTPPHPRGRDEPPPLERASAGTRAREDSSGGRPHGPTPSPVLRREHFALSFWQPRVSVADGMGTRSPAGRELSPDGERGRDEQYTLRTWRPQRSALIEEEIRSDLQREEELQEQRRRRLMDGGDGPSRESSRSRHSSAASGASGSYSVSGSPVPAPQQPGVLGLVASFTPLRLGCVESLGPDPVRCSPSEERRRRTKEEGKYAGIEPIDRINTECSVSAGGGEHAGGAAPERYGAALGERAPEHRQRLRGGGRGGRGLCTVLISAADPINETPGFAITFSRGGEATLGFYLKGGGNAITLF